MAISATITTTMGELYDKEDEDVVLNQLKSLAADTLPDGWKTWSFSADELDINSTIFNKLRFALPTMGVVKAFYPEGCALHEKKYKELKEKMLSWPFCRGLIYSPSTLSIKIRGYIQHQLLIESINPIKHLFSTRQEVAKKLSDDTEVSSDDTTFSDKSKRPSLSGRMDVIEKKFERTQEVLEAILRNVSTKPDVEEYTDSVEEDVEEDEDEEVEMENLESTWKPPSLVPIASHSKFDFAPYTKEQEPSIPPADPIIAENGVACQRLGRLSWDKIRYLDVQKKYQASPVFSPLTVNSGLSLATSPYSELLAKSDLSFGTLCHMVLKQRQHFQDIMSSLISKHPSIEKDAASMFSGDQSKFRECSDDILQWVCGKRAEIIDLRRKHHTSSGFSPLLQKIPPSSTHLFEEEKFEAVRRDQGLRTQSFKRRLPSQGYNNYDDAKRRKVFKVPSLNSRNFQGRQGSEKPKQKDRRWQDKESFRGNKRPFAVKDRKPKF